MLMKFLLVVSATIMATVAARADSQSSNTSSNSSSNNGVVRVVETYCEDDYCETYVKRRVYRTDRSTRRYLDYDHRRYRDRYMDDDDD